MSGYDQHRDSPFRPSSLNSSTCSTPNSKFNNQMSSSAFGEKKYVSKEDHERERARWLNKIEEIEKRLISSETLNSEMLITKAELRPMIDSNRKLGDRNKTLQQEIKKVEQKYCHSQDDFLTLKDAYERLQKENATLKEKRVSPEKLEELMTYRNQVLEYSKCITALRSSAYEKDKRNEMLVQKFKRLQKCLKKNDNDCDQMSNVGSDCSAASTVSLDTITEDFEEAFAKDIETNYQALYRENAELQRALNELQLNTSDLHEESFLRDQISFAHSTIEQQQLVIDATQDMMSQTAQLKSTIAAQQEQIRQLQDVIEELKQKNVSETERNDLLEFQVLEMEETSKQQTLETKEKLQAELELIKQTSEENLAKRLLEIEELKAKLGNIGDESVEVKELKEKLVKSETANANLNQEMRTLSKELGKIRFQLQGKETDLNRELKMTEALSVQLQQYVSNGQGESSKKEEELKKLKLELENVEKQRQELEKQLKDLAKEYAAYREEQRPEIRTELERRYEEARYRLKNALEKIHDYELLYEAAKKSENDGSMSKHLEEELIEVKEFNAHLQRQFQTQSNIIEALKKKVIQHRSFCDRVNKLSELEDPSRIQEELVMFSRENDCDDAKLASNIALIIKDIRKNAYYSPLEISTNHHKIRQYNSVDSSAEWQSNSSEGIVSPDENEE
ncbi:unnamed protein product [Caenorhabditis angaria]|uniref:JAKMIP_CC3 domain-containing protein n=1 Tax=Caenorhabditis angaria TaxID=860376 RepID=A0A9P1NC85_9PELO|nr:unnamed protein product [Caenorhabditis angaria]